VLFVRLLQQPKYMMERIDIIPDFIPKAHIFKNFSTCVKWIKENINDELKN
jgi:SulP family sulfate permease